jgi:AcrR family transcriptional regulator
LRVNLEARAANAEQRRAKTRLRLLEAAMAVIADKGPATASVEDFVAAAGVSRGTFYNYFPAIEDLLEALNAHLAKGLDSRLALVTEGERDPAMVLALIIHEAFRLAMLDPLRGWVALRIEGTSTPRMDLVAKRFDAIFQWAVDKGRFQRCDPDAARNLLFGAVRMAQQEILAQRADVAHISDLVRLALTAYGLEAAEAQRVSLAAREAVRRETHYSPVR